MLERVRDPSGVTFYISPLLRERGVPHAFSTRLGGVSPPPFDSLNLGNPSGCDVRDPSERIDENYRRLFDACGCGRREHAWVHQVHGSDVIVLERDRPHDNTLRADALVSDDPARILSIRIADCAPVLLASEDGRIVAAVHAGWRGVIAEAAIHALNAICARAGLSPDGIVAAIGPCIGLDAFEVGPEVIAEFERAFGPDAPIRRGADGHGNVDLRECLRRQLVTAGVHGDRIDRTDRCTVRDREEFFSHRRDRGTTGRMAAVIRAAG